MLNPISKPLTEKAQLAALLKNSSAQPDLKKAVQAFATGQPSERIQYTPGIPPIKVLRVLMKLLERFPNDRIAHVIIEGRSSCSSVYGTLTFLPQQTKIKFNWDCSWKANQEGMKTWYGAPDQTKAAQMFGYQCFETFEELES